MRTIIIGDVHGCDDELAELLALVKPTSQDTVVFAGDLMHKGPYSERVIDRARRLNDDTNVVLVRGNHEDNELRKRFLDITKEDWKFLENSVHWYVGKDFLVVHAGVPTSLNVLPTQEEINKLSKNKRSYYDQVLRIRKIDEHGKFVSLEDCRPYQKWWADEYDGRFGHVYFGHQPWKEVRKFKHATGLDLGCCYGNALCAVVAETNEFFTVKAKQVYCEQTYSWE